MSGFVDTMHSPLSSRSFHNSPTHKLAFCQDLFLKEKSNKCLPNNHKGSRHHSLSYFYFLAFMKSSYSTQNTRYTAVHKALRKAVRRVLVNNSNLNYGRVLKQKDVVDDVDRIQQQEFLDNLVEEERQDASPVGVLEEGSSSCRDPDLAQVLELSSDGELLELYECLHSTSLFSPIGKSLYIAGEGVAVGAGKKVVHSREDLELYIESRFRFLAADAQHVFQAAHAGDQMSQWPSYRDTLIDLRQRLGVPCSPHLATADLETEIFLHLLSEHGEYVQKHRGGVRRSMEQEEDEQSCNGNSGGGDGMTVSREGKQSLRDMLKASIVSPLSIGYRDLVPTLTKTLATVALTRVQVTMIQNLGSIVLQRAAHHKALAFIYAGSRELGKRMAVETAKQRMMGAVVQYTALRQIFTFVGPMLWLSTAWDLTKMSLGTDYARLSRTVFMMAQIRLVKTRGWSNRVSNE